jgi:hypothetical protein
MNHKNSHWNKIVKPYRPSINKHSIITTNSSFKPKVGDIVHIGELPFRIIEVLSHNSIRVRRYYWYIKVAYWILTNVIEPFIKHCRRLR